MKKKWLTLCFISIMLIAVLTAASFASDSIKLYVNGQEIKPDVPPQIINDRVMVPVRWAAEALGAVVEWDSNNRTVVINDDKKESLQRQLWQLERAVAPETIEEAAETWAEGVKTRNGALQYAVLSHGLREKYYDNFQNSGWTTGVSSPWVEKYNIKKLEEASGNVLFSVEFEMMTSTGSAGSYSNYISIQDMDGECCVTGIYTSLNQWRKQTDLYNQVDSLVNKQNQHYRLLEKNISLQSLYFEDTSAEAEYSVKVKNVMDIDNPADWPTQKGKIKFLEENRPELSEEALQKVEEHIAFWDKELRDLYIGIPSDSYQWIKIKAEFDSSGLIKENTVELYREAAGEYILFDLENELPFQSEEELVNLGYEQMKEFVESN